MQRHHYSLVLIAGFAVVGCGGGGGAADSSQQIGNSGNISYTYTRAAALKPAVFSSSNGAVITGLTGANFTKLQLNPIKAMAATKIAASVDGQVWVMNVDGSNPQPLGPVNPNGTQCHPSWYPNGTLIAFNKEDLNGYNQVFRMNSDGTGVQQLTHEPLNTYAVCPIWSPLGTKIAYQVHDSSGGDSIWTMNPDGSGQTQISPVVSGETDVLPSWSLDASTIYFAHRSSGGTFDIVSVPAGGGTMVLAMALGEVNAPRLAFAVGNIACFSNGSQLILGNSTLAGMGPVTSPPSGTSDVNPTFSPDGQTVIWTRSSATGTRIFQKHAGAVSEADTQLSDSLRNYDDAAWSPFPGNRTLVGQGGPLGLTASGFLFGEVFDVTQSVLTFSCTTPATATITNQSGSGNVTNAVFQISGDAITSLKYIADVYSQPTQIIPGSFTTATGALVSFNTATGRVSLVAPYSSAKRVGSKTGIAFDGRFLGIWKNGKNVASSASHVEISASGASCMWR